VKPGWRSLLERREFVLASGSPRRADLLRLAGIDFVLDPPGLEEAAGGDDPEGEAVRLAKAKAEAVAGRHANALVLGCDTEVLLRGKRMGKPQDGTEALDMLRGLRGTIHEVVTGMYLLDTRTGLSRSAAEKTSVKMRDFADAEALEYVRTGDPLDKAGGYGIQGGAALFVERIDGCYYNVVGLPLSRLVTMIEDLRNEIEARER